MDRNIAVAGCGYWGKNLVRNFAELGALHTICDSSPETLTQFKAQYPHINTQVSYADILGDDEVKGVVISTPAALHYAMAQQALLAGKDVMVEKPLALEIEEGRDLVTMAEEKKCILMVGHLLLYHPCIIKLKDIVDSGEVGNINYIYSSRLNLGKFRTEENILWSFAPHDISVITFLLDSLPEFVSAHGGYYLHKDIADVTVTNLSFPNNTRAHIFVSWLHPYKEQKLVVVGDRKMVVFDDARKDDKLVLYDHKIELIDQFPIATKQEPVPVDVDTTEPLKLECQHFLDCIRSRKRPRTDGENGLKVLRILDACQRSLSREGTNVMVTDKEAYYVHSSSIVEQPCEIGAGTKIWHYSHIMPRAEIGENCNIGQNVFIGQNAMIGNNVKIQNNVSVYEGVILEDDVFCGPSCVFTNIKKPRSHISQKGKYVTTLVKMGATIGANATIICGVTIGKYAFIGAGSLVTRDIPDHALFYGNPAKIAGWVCKCGTMLDFNDLEKARCSSCSTDYHKIEGGIKVEGADL